MLPQEKAPEASYAMRAHRTAREGVCRAGHRRQAFGSCISAEACAPISQVEPAKPVAVMLGVPAGGPIVDGAPPAVGSAGSTREAAGMPVRAPWSPQSAACVLVFGDRRSLDKGLSRVAVLLPAVHVGWGGQGMHGLASWRPGSRLRLLASCAAREQKADDSGKEGCNLAAVQTERRAGHCPPHQPVSVQPDAAAAIYDGSVISHPPRVSPLLMKKCESCCRRATPRPGSDGRGDGRRGCRAMDATRGARQFVRSGAPERIFCRGW